ncbi:MAG: CPBP family intramembrane metalloprotease [Candidatus Obscuribacterales bacterium]|nr:CPBP family intramembrane metalloprotease [Candidatus Obscuribacterales bacterium]
MNDNKRAGWMPLKGSLLLFFVLGIVGVAFFFWKYDDVFPAAALNLKLSKAEILQKSRTLCESLSYARADDCIESSTFQEKSDTATFLEHEYSMKEANTLMQAEIPVFFWYTRFCRAHNEEELQIWLDTEGRLLGFNHDIQKEKALPSISQDEAMIMALKFAAEKGSNQLYADLKKGEAPVLLDGIKLISSGSEKQLNRVDHTFVFEDQRKDYKGGHIRTTVQIYGNIISGYDRSLHVPQSFELKFNDMRSYNELLKSISSVLFAVVAAAMFFAFVWAASQKRLRWKLLIVTTIVSFFVEILDYWNSYSSILQFYSTSESLQGYLFSRLLSSLFRSAMVALMAAMLVGGIEAVYRLKFPRMIALENFLDWKLFDRQPMLETFIAGISVFGVHLGYVAAYYLLGQQFGMWSPLEVREVATISSVVPAFSAFAVGVNASVSEELLYRVLCFVLAQLIFRNFWIANFVQAVGWAFMHSDYPQEPAYARGLELTIVGLFYGFVMRRYGVFAGIISHFIYDAFLGVTPLLLSQSASLAASGVLAFSAPFIALALGLFRRTRRHSGKDLSEPLQDELLNESVQKTPPPVENLELIEERHLQYKPLTKKARSVILLLCLSSILVTVFVQPHKMGDWARISVSKEQIEKNAAQFLKERGVEESGFRMSPVLSVNLDDEEILYGVQKEGYAKTERVMKTARIPLLWWVRFYKPHQHREYDVMVSADGKPVSLQIEEEEDAPGGKPAPEDARKIVESYLKRYRPEFQPLEFESVRAQKRKNRTDYIVSFVAPALKLGDARLKLRVETVGLLVSFPHIAWDIPDSWRFGQNKKTLKDNLANGIAQVLVVIAAGFILVWAFGLFKAQTIHWRPVLIVAAVSGLSTLINSANEFVYKLNSYDTDVPFANFLTTLGVQSLVSAIFYAAIFSVLFALGHGAFRLLCPGVTLQSLFYSTLRPAKDRLEEARLLWIDAAFSAYLWVLGGAAISAVFAVLQSRFSPDVMIQSLDQLVSLTHYSSASYEQITSGISFGVLSLCLAPAIVGFYLKYFRSFKRYFLISLFLLLLLALSRKFWQDYLIEVFSGAVDLAVFYYWIKCCARNNPLAYFLSGVFTVIFASLVLIFKFAPSVFSLDFGLLLAVFLAPLAVPFLLRARKETLKSEA